MANLTITGYEQRSLKTTVGPLYYVVTKVSENILGLFEDDTTYVSISLTRSDIYSAGAYSLFVYEGVVTQFDALNGLLSTKISNNSLSYREDENSSWQTLDFLSTTTLTGRVLSLYIVEDATGALFVFGSATTEVGTRYSDVVFTPNSGLSFGTYMRPGWTGSYSTSMPKTSAEQAKMYGSLLLDESTPSSEDPYAPGGTTEPEEGPTDGDWELPQDELNTNPALVDSSNTKLFRAFAMTLSQVQAFGQKLWTRNILDTLITHFESPLDVVSGVIEYPFPITQAGESAPITFNWIEEWAQASTVQGQPLTGEYQTIDFGSIEIGRYSGTFYDFQPFSSVMIYLPYIGYVPLKMNEVIGKTLSLKYVVSLTSGSFAAVITSSGVGVIGVYTGAIGRPLPLSGRDLFDTYAGIISAAVQIGMAAFGAVSAGAPASPPAGGYVPYDAPLQHGVVPQAMDPELEKMGWYKGEASEKGKWDINWSGVGHQAAQSAIDVVGSINAPIQRSSSLSGVNGRNAPQNAGVLISVPHQNVSEMQQILGYPSNLAGPLSDYEGYTEVRQIILKIPNATAAELSEIESAVRSGIII